MSQSSAIELSQRVDKKEKKKQKKQNNGMPVKKIIVKYEPVHSAFENGQHNDAYAYIIILKWYFDLWLCHWVTFN